MKNSRLRVSADSSNTRCYSCNMTSTANVAKYWLYYVLHDAVWRSLYCRSCYKNLPKVAPYFKLCREANEQLIREQLRWMILQDQVINGHINNVWNVGEHSAVYANRTNFFILTKTVTKPKSPTIYIASPVILLSLRIPAVPKFGLHLSWLMKSLFVGSCYESQLSGVARNEMFFLQKCLIQEK